MDKSLLAKGGRLATAIPQRMRTRPKDARGYPVPFIVMIDKTGLPQFTINDVRRVADCHSKRLCAICGKRHDKQVWFVGGSRCFLHPHGAFIDPPMHHDCAEYALRVCPFLALPSYSRRVEDRKLKPEGRHEDLKIVRTDFMNPMQPELFGLGSADSYRIKGSAVHGDQILIVDRWNYVEFWKAGEPVNAPDKPVPEDQAWERFA